MQPPSLLSRLERDLDHASDETAAEAALRIGEHLLTGEVSATLLATALSRLAHLHATARSERVRAAAEQALGSVLMGGCGDDEDTPPSPASLPLPPAAAASIARPLFVATGSTDGRRVAGALRLLGSGGALFAGNLEAQSRVLAALASGGGGGGGGGGNAGNAENEGDSGEDALFSSFYSSSSSSAAASSCSHDPAVAAAAAEAAAALCRHSTGFAEAAARAAVGALLSSSPSGSSRSSSRFCRVLGAASERSPVAAGVAIERLSRFLAVGSGEGGGGAGVVAVAGGLPSEEAAAAAVAALARAGRACPGGGGAGAGGARKALRALSAVAASVPDVALAAAASVVPFACAVGFLSAASKEKDGSSSATAAADDGEVARRLVSLATEVLSCSFATSTPSCYSCSLATRRGAAALLLAAAREQSWRGVVLAQQGSVEVLRAAALSRSSSSSEEEQEEERASVSCACAEALLLLLPPEKEGTEGGEKAAS